jgi:glyoxylase-like metal-dependent hydrolase (beta-lactamase superfamily II)
MMRRAAFARIALVSALGASLALSVGGPSRIALTTVAPGVHVARRVAPPGLILDANSVFIVNDADVIVVDAHATPSSAREALTELRALTPKPVSAVVFTHWHDDHVLGSQVYRDAFPKAAFVAHADVPAALADEAAASRRLMLDRAPRMMTELQVALDQNKSLSGGASTDEERASYEHDAWLLDRYQTEAPSAVPVRPTETVHDSMTLTRGARRIEIRSVGHAHSAGDLVIHLPRERVLIAGDLIAWPAPLVGSTSHPRTFRSALDTIAAFKPAAIVPGHGPIVRDLAYVQRTARLLDALTSQVGASVARGDEIADTRRVVRLDDLRREFAGDSRLFGFLFEHYVLSSGVAAAVAEVRTQK